MPTHLKGSTRSFSLHSFRMYQRWGLFYKLGPYITSITGTVDDLEVSIKSSIHDAVIKWKHFPGHCPFVRGVRHPWIAPTKASDAELWCFFFIYAWTNRWTNNGDAGDLSSLRAHYDVTVIWLLLHQAHTKTLLHKIIMTPKYNACISQYYTLTAFIKSLTHVTINPLHIMCSIHSYSCF